MLALQKGLGQSILWNVVDLEGSRKRRSLILYGEKPRRSGLAQFDQLAKPKKGAVVQEENWNNVWFVRRAPDRGKEFAEFTLQSPGDIPDNIYFGTAIAGLDRPACVLPPESASELGQGLKFNAPEFIRPKTIYQYKFRQKRCCLMDGERPFLP